MKQVAIITGASSGIGESFALEIDKRKNVDEIWLIARRADRLEILMGKLTCKAVILALDLTLSSDMQKLKNAFDNQRPNLRYLINCAGFGLIGEFSKLDMYKQLNMIDLNVKALTEMTYMALPYCQKGSEIINIASSAGFYPMPWFTTYAATKAYVIHFSNALAGELYSQGIHVCVACPGPVNTEFFQIATENKKNKYLSLHASPEYVARKALRDSACRKLFSTYGVYTFFLKVTGLIPRFFVKTKMSHFMNVR